MPTGPGDGCSDDVGPDTVWPENTNAPAPAVPPTAVATAPKAAFPARCAVAVIYGEHLVSQVYLASIPVEVFIDDIVELLDEDLSAAVGRPLDPDRLAYELHRASGTRLDISRNLDELGVEDGATWSWCRPNQVTPSCPNMNRCRQVWLGLAKTAFHPGHRADRAATALAIIAMAVLVATTLTVHTRLLTDSWGHRSPP